MQFEQLSSTPSQHGVLPKHARPGTPEYRSASHRRPVVARDQRSFPIATEMKVASAPVSAIANLFDGPVARAPTTGANSRAARVGGAGGRCGGASASSAGGRGGGRSVGGTGRGVGRGVGRCVGRGVGRGAGGLVDRWRGGVGEAPSLDAAFPGSDCRLSADGCFRIDFGCCGRAGRPRCAVEARARPCVPCALALAPARAPVAFLSRAGDPSVFGPNRGADAPTSGCASANDTRFCRRPLLCAPDRVPCIPPVGCDGRAASAMPAWTLRPVRTDASYSLPTEKKSLKARPPHPSPRTWSTSRIRAPPPQAAPAGRPAIRTALNRSSTACRTTCSGKRPSLARRRCAFGIRPFPRCSCGTART